MNKKILVLALMSIFLISMFAGVVKAAPAAAEEDKGIAGMILESKTIKTLFGDNILTEDILLLRVLFAIMIFALLFGVSNLVLGKLAQGPRIAISLVLAIISVVAIPKELFAAIPQW